jgi:hypothetical protein
MLDQARAGRVIVVEDLHWLTRRRSTWSSTSSKACATLASCRC